MSSIDTLTKHALRAARPHEARSRLLVLYSGMLALLFAALTFARFQWFGSDKYWEGLVDKMSAGVVLGLIAVFWYWLIAPRASFNENLEVVEAWNIEPKLEAPLRDTKSYWFRGRSARWFRAKALPKLAAAATKDSSGREVTLILPDPGRQDVLEAYAAHRNSLPDAASDSWTAGRIRTEILATILVAGKTAADNRLVRVRIHLVPDFSVVRYDLSDTGLMMTREDKRWPGWFSGANSRFYNSVKEDLRIIAERGRELDLGAVQWPNLAISRADVPAIVTALGFNITLTPEEARSVYTAMKSDKSPYA